MRRLLAGTVLTVAVGLSTVAVADPSPSPTSAAPEAPLQILVKQLLPRAPQVHDAVELIGTVTNVGTSAVTDIALRMKVGDVLQFRGELHAADTDRPLTTRRQAFTIPSRSTLRPGESASFDLRTTVDVLQLKKLGVYPLDLEARGNAGDGTESLGLAPTWLPYFPDAPKPLRVAVAWPLVDVPHQGVNNALLDDDLADELAPTGRLGGLLAAARLAEIPECTRGATGPRGNHDPAITRCEQVPVTYAVDPDLIGAAGAMTSPYKVGKKNGNGTSVAGNWLAGLRDGIRAGALLALPFADPDVSALSRANGGQEDLALASVLGRNTVTEVLKAAPLDAVVWPPPGPVSQAGADALARSGARQFILDESAYGQPESEQDRTPNTRSVFTTSATGAGLDGLVADPYLSDLVTGPDAATLGPRLAEQRFLAETAIIAAEYPGRARTLLIAPPRRTDVSREAATGALRDLGRVPWLCPVTLAAVANGTESCFPANPLEAEERGDPRTDPAGQLSRGFLDGIAKDRDVVGQLTGAVLSDSQDPAIRADVARTKERLRKAIARAESSAWRSDAQAGNDVARRLHLEATRLRDKVVVRGGKALLTSSKGTLQVSVENTLDVPIDIRVRFWSGNDVLLAAETKLVQVPAGHAVPAGVKAETRRSGQFVVLAQMIDRDGNPFGARAEVIVRSTRFGRLALAVTAGGAGVLLVAAGVRIFRRAARAR